MDVDIKAPVLPESLAHLAGRINDVDTHEMMPLQEWTKQIGVEVEPLAEAFIASGATDADNINHPYLRNYSGDNVEIGPDILKIKGSSAPGATDVRRRLEVMDVMGIKQQLMFPTGVGIWAAMMLLNDGFFPGATPRNRRETLLDWLRLYNEWGIGASKISDRIRPVLPLFGGTPAELLENARYLVGNGIRAVWLMSGILPGGKSPAHPDHDALWSYLSRNNCVATLHVGGEGKFFETREWRNAPSFDGYKSFVEFDADPWSMATLHLPSEIFLMTMVGGGVFERHPGLRMGVIELGAFWLGPLMERLDLGYEQFANIAPGIGLHSRLPKKPSTYIKSNVRVTPYFFEDIASYLDRYDCEDILCFSSDYPHVEGGKDTFNSMYKKVEKFGPRVVEKFFSKNGEFLFAA
jgi:hypothetical protein